MTELYCITFIWLIVLTVAGVSALKCNKLLEDEYKEHLEDFHNVKFSKKQEG